MFTIEINGKGTIQIADGVEFHVDPKSDMIVIGSPVPATGSNVRENQFRGKLIFIEQDRASFEDPKKVSNYHNGEYYCVRNSRNVLYLAKLTQGYKGHDLHAFNLIGEGSYKVIDVTEPSSEVVQDFITKQQTWISDALEGRVERQWVESVYSEAQDVVNQVKKAAGL